MKQTHIGKSVYHVWDSRNIRFGSVVDEKMEGAWKYLLVAWVDDEFFEASKKEVTNPKETPNYPDWYRIDNVKVFEPDDMMSSLQKL